MARGRRSNPLALAVLMCLYERPMHPYEVAATLRERGKHESVRLNYGSLYAVVGSLERAGLIEAAEVVREGRLPERTVYRITDAGRLEAHDWLADLIAEPVKEYPAFEAGLSFLPALAPQEAQELLERRLFALDLAIALWQGARELIERRGLPRLLWVEGEYAATLREAERGYVARLLADIAAGELDGIDWWRELHAGDLADAPPPPGYPYVEPAANPLDDGKEQR